MDERKPILQALLLADHVYQDARTGKFIVCGIFTQLVRLVPKSAETNSTSKPVASYLQSGNPYVYFALTDYAGPISLEFRYVDLSNNHSLLIGKVDNINSASPLELIQGSMPIPKLPAPHAGTYSFDLLFRGDVLGAIRVSVTDHELSSEAIDNANP